MVPSTIEGFNFKHATWKTQKMPGTVHKATKKAFPFGAGCFLMLQALLFLSVHLIQNCLLENSFHSRPSSFQRFSPPRPLTWQRAYLFETPKQAFFRCFCIDFFWSFLAFRFLFVWFVRFRFQVAQVVNGNLSQSKLSSEFLSPLCPSYSTEHMQNLCDTSWARERSLAAKRGA